MTRARPRIVLLAALGVSAVAATVAANVALLGLADQRNDLVGRLQLRLDRPLTVAPGRVPAVKPAPPVARPATAPAVDDGQGPDD